MRARRISGPDDRGEISSCRCRPGRWCTESVPWTRKRQWCPGGPKQPGEAATARIAAEVVKLAGPGHNVVRHGRVIWCTRCAAYSSQCVMIKGLSKPCKGYVADSHKTNLGRLAHGKFPVKVKGEEKGLAP